MAAAPILPALRPDFTGIVVVEVTAAAWLRLATLTRYPRSRSPRHRTGPAAPAPAAQSPTTTAAPLPRRGAVMLRGLGMLAGRSARRIPEAEAKLRSGARQAGRHAARLQRAWSSPAGEDAAPNATPGGSAGPDGDAPGI